MRTLAIDVGTKRIGLALSDAGGRFATPLEVISAQPEHAALKSVCDLVAGEQVQRIIIGLPLNMDDSMGPAAKKAIEWAGRLARECRIEPVFVDERLSSFSAEQQLRDRKRAGEKLTRGKKKQQLDAIAAAVFLQEFLDGKLPAVDIDEPV